MSGIIDIDCGIKTGNAINPPDGDKKGPVTIKTLIIIVGIGLVVLFVAIGGFLMFMNTPDAPVTGIYDIKIDFALVNHTIGENCTMRVVEITHVGGESVENVSTLYVLPYIPEQFEINLIDRVIPVYEKSLKHFREGEKIYLYLGVDGMFHLGGDMPNGDDFVDFPDGDYMVSVEDARYNRGIAQYNFTIEDSHTLLVHDDKTITGAIRNSDDHESILVYGDLYKERLRIDKPVRIFAVNRAIIDGGNLEAVVLVTASDVHIQGFNIKNSGSGEFIDGGIVIQSPARNVKIIDNEIQRCSSGVWIWQSNMNEIYNNYIHNNDHNGIWIQNGHNNDIRYNMLYNNKYGLHVESGEYNYIVENKFTGNKLYGIYIPNWVHLENVCEYNDLGKDKHEFGKIVTRE